jgi:predicted RNase H-like HicB family nuclease
LTLIEVVQGAACCALGSLVGSIIRAGGQGMQVQLTAVFRRVSEGYIAFVEELPGANTQGNTLEEARSNLQEAVALVFEANRVLAEEELRDEDVIREPFRLSA